MSNKDRIQISGRVLQDATVALIPKSKPRQYGLTVMVAPAQGLPYVATQPLEDGRAAEFAARCKARLMRTGALVHIYASHLQLRREAGQKVLRVEAVTDIQPFDQPATRFEAETTTEA